MQAVLTTFDRVLPSTLTARDQRAARHLALLAAITAACVPLLVLMYHLMGFDAASVAVLCCGAVMVLAPLTMRAGAGLALARDLFVGGLFVLKIWLAAHLGGLAASTTPWFVLCPLVAMLVGGLRPGLAWSGAVLVVYLGMFAWGRLHGGFVPHPVADQQILDCVGQVGLLALVTIIALCFRNEAERAH